MSDYRELLLGCGHSREKRLGLPGERLEWRGLVTVDHNEDVDPDYCIDLNQVEWSPFRVASTPNLWTHLNDDAVIRSDHFDEVHAYEVLEHMGQQGDADSFFACFSEIWRVLKPNGHLFATVPSRYSAWLWGDPSHRRAILKESLVFLDQTQYIRQLDHDRPTPMSDFRNIYTADFDIVESSDNQVTHIFCLRAVKPSRIPDRFK